MVHNSNNFVNEFLRNFLIFSAYGKWGKEKNVSAEKFVYPKALRANPNLAGKKKRGLGGNEFLPARTEN